MKKMHLLPTVILILLASLFGLPELKAQERNVQGRISSQEDGSGLPGVGVVVKGTSTGTVTDASGNYRLSVPAASSVLVFSFVGFVTQEVTVGNQTTIDAVLVPDIQALSEVVVTGYTTQQKKDITGAVAVVKPRDLLSVPAASFTQQLEGRAPGVVVGTSGEPGAGASIRIRGIGSFNGNDPLYIIDGVPVTGAFQNGINPNDIESMQILKDASATSIYGARASNGVIIITTKKGSVGPAKLSYDSYVGIQSNGSPRIRMLNPTEYANLIWQSYQNVGQTPPSTLYGSEASPVLPDYVVPGGAMEGDPRVDPANYTTNINDPAHGSTKFVITRANKQGTDWQREIYRSAPIQSHNLNIAGGSDKSRYNLGMSYFDQSGIVKHTYFKRYTMRANSEFTVKNNLRIGENFQFNFIDQVNVPGGNQNEGNPITKALQHHSLVPVYDINGNWSANKAPGIGTGQNPFAQLVRNKDNTVRNIQLLGNVFAEATFLKDFVARTSFGLQYGVGWRRNFTYRTYEASEPNASNGYSESGDYNSTWTWTNTLVYTKNLGDLHTIKLLAGTEAIKNAGRNISASRNNYFIDDPLYRSLNGGEKNQQNSGNGFASSLYSLFARADYSFADKYLLAATIRRDGSSRVGYADPYGTFPAVSLGWRVSREGFMQNISFLDDLKLRVGWGRTGNQEIDAANSYGSFGGTLNGTAYAITGSNSTTTSGYAVNRYGNPFVRWESQTSTNVGLDAALFKGKFDLTLDVYRRITDDLLYKLPFPSTAGIAQVPFINVGKMRNAGVELGLNYRGTVGGELKVDVGLNLTHYKNEILRVGESAESFFTGGGSRYGDIARSQQGQPMSSFYGYVVQGIFQTADEVQAAATQPGISKVFPDPFTDYDTPNGKVRGFGIGRFRYQDINSDGVIDEKDQTFVGSPHPDLIYGLNVGLSYRAFDFTAFFQGTVGNELYFYNRWWTDFNSFQMNRSQEMLYESWRPDRTDARLPLLDVRDAFANGAPNSYYVQDGSYLRAKSIVLGYSLPTVWSRKLGIDKARLYLQGQNLFTITGYEGMDPAMGQRDPGALDSGISVADRAIGIDFGNYPVPRTFLVGLNVTF